MTLVFIAVGFVSFVAITVRFLSRVSSKEPAASRVK